MKAKIVACLQRGVTEHKKVTLEDPKPQTQTYKTVNKTQKCVRLTFLFSSLFYSSVHCYNDLYGKMLILRAYT